jgi:hypothetical protein
VWNATFEPPLPEKKANETSLYDAVELTFSNPVIHHVTVMMFGYNHVRLNEAL